MCGIVGIYDLEQQGHLSKNIIAEMANAIHHRGPDDDGFFYDETVELAFKRLAIIDLNHGKQPMFNEDESLLLICNGEIYNYKELRSELMLKGHTFRSECDVEVILHLYEEYKYDFLNRLNGQFSFALYDKEKRELFIARDQVGIAPLFYTKTNGYFMFASEIKALLKHPFVERKVNLTGLDQILTFPGNVSPTTMFSNIDSVKPGNYIVIGKKGIKINEYWDLNYSVHNREQEKPESYYIETLNDLLYKAVKYRLNADVPVGFYLSGGLDSSLVASLISSMKSDERYSFSIAFNQNEIDERKYQKIIQSHVGSVHNELLFDWEDISKRLKSAVYYSEAPLKETYNTCSLALSESVRKNNVKVILTGEGSDELFGGYVGYRFDNLRESRSGGLDYEMAMEEEIREKLWGDSGFLYEKNYFSYAETKQALYSEKLKEKFLGFECLREGIVDKSKLKGRDRFQKRSYLDFKLRLSDHLVADHGDRVSYANSIEVRYPFLDIDVIEFAKSIPSSLKLNNMVEKYVVKKCSEKYVPKSIIDREKFSFVAPGSQYLIKQNIEWVNDLLSYETIKRQGYFNPDVVERLKRMYLSKNFNLNQTFETDLLMIVLTFGIFLDVFQMPDNS